MGLVFHSFVIEYRIVYRPVKGSRHVMVEGKLGERAAAAGFVAGDAQAMRGVAESGMFEEEVGEWKARLYQQRYSGRSPEGPEDPVGSRVPYCSYGAEVHLAGGEDQGSIEKARAENKLDEVADVLGDEAFGW